MGLSVPGRGRGLGAKRFGHRGVGEPLVADAHEVALLRSEALALEQRLGDIARLGGEALRAARLREPRQGVDQRSADALASEFGLDEQHVDLVCAFEAGEAGDRAVDHGKQGQCLGQIRAESLFVVLGRQLLHARSKDLGAAPRVGRQIGAKRDGAHRFGSQLVVPSLLSLMATPSAASWSRRRSDSAQFFVARAMLLQVTKLLISAASIFASLSAIACRSDRVCCRRPRRLAVLFMSSGADICPTPLRPAVISPMTAGWARRWSSERAAGVFKSSAKAWSTSGAISLAGSTSPTASYQRSSVVSASSSAFSVQSIG